MSGRFRSLLNAGLLVILAMAASAPAVVRAAPLAPTIAISFGAPGAAVGTAVSLTTTITNPNLGVTLTGISVTDSFPASLMLATPDGLSGSCGGGTITPAMFSLDLTGAILGPGASCTYSVDVVGLYQSHAVNTTGNVTSNESGPGEAATAAIDIGYPPTVSLTFSPASIPLNGTSTLTIGLYNPETSSTDLVGLSVTATLPAGLTVTDGSIADACGGSVAISGGNTIALTGGSLYVSWVCSFSVAVTGPAVAGVYTVTTGPVTSTNGVQGTPGTGSLFVNGPPAIAMAFDPANVTVGANPALTFTITNPPANATDVTDVAVMATLPAGMTVADGTTSACGGILNVGGGNTISLTGATASSSWPCTFSVVVTVPAIGTYTAASLAITSAFGTGGTATANLVVNAPTLTPTPTPTASAVPVTTLPPTSAAGGDAADSSGPFQPMLLLLGLAIGLIATYRVQRSGNR